MNIYGIIILTNVSDCFIKIYLFIFKLTICDNRDINQKIFVLDKLNLKEIKMALKGTFSAKPTDIKKDWFVVDAEGLVLGRLAVIIANRLRGKHKVGLLHMACGDNIIVINCEKVLLTCNKRTQKTYYWYTGYPGGIKERQADKILDGRFPDRVIRKAVERMVPVVH